MAFLVTLLLALTLLSPFPLLKFGMAVLPALPSLPEYCEGFPANLRPLICILRENKLVPKSSTTTTPSSRNTWGTTTWPEYESEEDEDEPQCSCDINCFPPPDVNSSEESRLDCRPCGNHCGVTTAVNPRCSCAAVGSGFRSILKRQQQQKCSCTVACASNPSQSQEPFCIFNVTGLRGSDSPRHVNCECCKSKQAENSDYPDFVCICQRI